MAIINQNTHPISLPNFCNMGINLRILIIVNGAGLLAAAVKTSNLAMLWQELLNISTILQPILLLSLIALCLSNRWLAKLSYSSGAITVTGLTLILTTAVYTFLQRLFGNPELGELHRYWLFCLLITTFLLAYFHLRSRALSPALTEARLQALQARIRPHFLFNSINAVLSLIRSDPKRAEHALENMADLFRVVMADN